MCGIWAFVTNKKDDYSDLYTYFNKIQHRGPDRSEFHRVTATNAFVSVYVGFHRLAIINPNVESDQPYKYQGTIYDDENSATVYLLCNGEIYNYKELAAEHDIDAHSDCDVLLPLLLNQFHKHGSEHISPGGRLHDSMNDLYSLINGEFAIIAIVIDDYGDVTISCMRDNYGVRQLYCATSDNSICVSSELKGISLSGGRPVNPRCVTTTTVSRNGKMSNCNLNPDLDYDPPPLSLPKFTIDENIEDMYIDLIYKVFCDSVKRRLHSDRPIGFLLSGGLDSSSVCGVSQQFIDKPIRTFSLGVEGATDTPYALSCSEFIGSDHTVVNITREELARYLADIPKTTETPDITTNRASVPMLAIARYIAENTDIKVLLVGDGADELMSGYKENIFCPSDYELHDNAIYRTNEVHLFDGKRVDSCLSECGIEARLPFLDKEFVSLYLSIDVSYRRARNGSTKDLFRKAMEKYNVLPKDVLWRPKEALSDGISSEEDSWHKYVQSHLGDEKKHYMDVWKESFPAADLDRIMPHYWMHRWGPNCDKDPSARELV